MEDLELRALTEKDEAAHAHFIEEMLNHDGRIVPSATEIKETDGSFKNWLVRTESEAKGAAMEKGRVPAAVLFLFRKGESKILAAVNVRYELNDFLMQHGGNIGYGVAPSERQKGYASKMLAMALDFCRKLKLEKVLVTCDADNIGSAKTIVKNGGILENEFVSERDGKLTQRYWIKL